jgi:hypothetical protein
LGANSDEEGDGRHQGEADENRDLDDDEAAREDATQGERAFHEVTLSR